jgi:hypothetical protein
VSEEIAGHLGSISPTTRVQVAGVVLMGQIVGFLLAALVLSVFGLASQVLPFLRSPSVGVVLYAITVVPGPLLCSWGFLKRSALHPSPLVICIISYLAACALFICLVLQGDGSRQAFGVMLPRALVMLPLASALGSFLSSYIQPRLQSRAG